MSQEKVDRKKSNKQNRKAIMKANKRKNILIGICTAVIAAALICFVAYSGYTKYQSYKESQVASTEIDLSGITKYITGLSSDNSSTASSEASDPDSAEYQQEHASDSTSTSSDASSSSATSSSSSAQ